MKYQISFSYIKNIIFIAFTFIVTSCSNTSIDIDETPVLVVPPSEYTADEVTEVVSAEVRTYKTDADELKEISGAKCNVEGDNFKTQVMSPSIISLPLYGKSYKSTIKINCELDGLTGVGNQTVEHDHSNYLTEVKAILK